MFIDQGATIYIGIGYEKSLLDSHILTAYEHYDNGPGQGFIDSIKDNDDFLRFWTKSIKDLFNFTDMNNIENAKKSIQYDLNGDIIRIDLCKLDKPNTNYYDGKELLYFMCFFYNDVKLEEIFVY